MTLYMIRHGETDWNTEHRLQGQSKPDMPLNEAGQAQAKRIAEFLLKSGAKLDAVYSSVLLRAVQTGEIIADALSVPHILNPDLNEISFGKFEGFVSSDFKALILPDGMTGEELRRRHKSINPAFDDTRHPGGENKREVRARIAPALLDIAKNGSALVVMHNAAFRIFMSAYDPAQAELPLDHHHLVMMDIDSQSVQISRTKIN